MRRLAAGAEGATVQWHQGGKYVRTTSGGCIQPNGWPQRARLRADVEHAQVAPCTAKTVFVCCGPAGLVRCSHVAGGVVRIGDGECIQGREEWCGVVCGVLLLDME